MEPDVSRTPRSAKSKPQGPIAAPWLRQQPLRVSPQKRLRSCFFACELHIPKNHEGHTDSTLEITV